jgi:hypothetical protein
MRSASVLDSRVVGPVDKARACEQPLANFEHSEFTSSKETTMNVILVENSSWRNFCRYETEFEMVASRRTTRQTQPQPRPYRAKHFSPTLHLKPSSKKYNHPNLKTSLNLLHLHLPKECPLTTSNSRP